jgi:hypothetical protein
MRCDEVTAGLKQTETALKEFGGAALYLLVFHTTGERPPSTLIAVPVM